MMMRSCCFRVLPLLAAALACSGSLRAETSCEALAGKLGVFSHYLPATADIKRIGEFDVERLADQLAEIGADYYGLTLGQYRNAYCTPSAAYDRAGGYKPGDRCATRDIPMELSDALAKRGIKLMLYLPSEPSGYDRAAVEGFGFNWEGHGGDRAFTEAGVNGWAQAIAEWSRRYGTRVFAWWFDGAYPNLGFCDRYAKVYAAAAREGNPDVLLTFNDGLRAVPWTAYSDYTAGEVNVPFDEVCDGPFVKGKRWHVLTFVGPCWNRHGLRFTDEQWIRWLARAIAHGGAVTVDAGIAIPQGTLDPEHAAQLKRVFAGARAAAKRPLPTVEPHDRAVRIAPEKAWFTKGVYVPLALDPAVGPDEAVRKLKDGLPGLAEIGPTVRPMIFGAERCSDAALADYAEEADRLMNTEHAKYHAMPVFDMAAFADAAAMTNRLAGLFAKAPVYGYRIVRAERFPLSVWLELRRTLEAVRPIAMMIGDAKDPAYYVKAFDAVAPAKFALPRSGEGAPSVADYRRARNLFRDRYPVGLPVLPSPLQLPESPALRRTLLNYVFHFNDLICLPPETIAAERQLIKDFMPSRLHRCAFSAGTLMWLDTDCPDDVLAFNRSAFYDWPYVGVFSFSEKPVKVRVSLPGGQYTVRGEAIYKWNVRDAGSGALEFPGEGYFVR